MGSGDQNHPPPGTLGFRNVPPVVPQVFVANIGGVQLTVGRMRDDPTMRSLLIGPLVLTIPLTDDNVTQIVEELMGVSVIRGINPKRLDNVG